MLSELRSVEPLGELGGLREIEGLCCPDRFGAFKRSLTGLKDRADVPDFWDIPSPSVLGSELDGPKSEDDVGFDSDRLLNAGCTFGARPWDDNLLCLLAP